MRGYDKVKLGLSVVAAAVLGHLPAMVVSPGVLGLVIPAQVTTALDHRLFPFSSSFLGLRKGLPALGLLALPSEGA